MRFNPKFILSICLFSLFGFAQEPLPENPKIGLVLSGGGAKGLAHIGVLKVIDSLGIRIDYIGGSSMGAVVGGLYATGYSGQQLDSIFRDIDFDVLLGDKVPRPSKTFQERKNAEKYAASLPLNDFKLKLPSSISRGQNVFNLLTKLTKDEWDINDFSKLSIPFYCIATNMETGEAIVLDKGNLAEAMSISSILPTLFQPIEKDGILLMDGGIANNYPVEILKAKNLDYIIGVNVQEDLLTKDEIKSVSEILSQINSFRSSEAMKAKKEMTDLFIEPNVEGYNVISFNKGSEIIEKGKKAVTPFLNELKRLKISQNFTKKNKKVNDIDTLKINGIDILGNEKYTDSYVLGKLRFRRGETLSFEDFNNGVNNLLATNNFDSFRYKFLSSENQEYDFIGTVRETANTSFLKLGVHYDQVLKSSVLLNFTKKQLLLKNDVLSLDFILGDNSRFNFDYYIDKGFYWSIGLNANYKRFRYDINPLFFDASLPEMLSSRIPTTLSDFTGSFFVETLIKKDFSLKIGATFKRLNMYASSPSLVTTFQDVKYQIVESDFSSTNATLKYDTLDDVYFPSSGFLFEGSGDLYLTGSKYDNFSQFLILKANIAKAFSINDRISILAGTEGGFMVGDDKISSLHFGLGGYAHNHLNNYSSFFGYDFFSLTGNSFVKAYFSADYEFYKRHHINISGNFTNIGNDIFLEKEWFTLPSYKGFAIGYGLETIFGPIELKFHWSPENDYSGAFVNLGYWF
ncbi:MAG: patatin-like phospholipase family protein [Bacteroidetes bacterium]|nr:patatin-like phospholipase family protein [Bacteroidota bacterium]MDA0860952.1 patatin-like phospholipase family protein [Bacteroidota bacterium]MDA1318827.1 patatin-like phospholipase family protein [Bacteroidota bacterium]